MHFKHLILIVLSVLLFLSAIVPLEMVKIPSGYYKTFIKSNGEDSIKVESFFLDKYPVTNKEFLEFIKANAQWSRSKIKRTFADENYLRQWKNDFEIESNISNSPVTNVSWFAARAYCEWKNKRLPSMNEWDYAASFPPGNSELNNNDIILKWYGKPSKGIPPSIDSGYKSTLGIYDMHGLIWEWAEDFNSLVISDGARNKEEIKFSCGGAANTANWEDYASYMRYAFRSSLKATYCNSSLGFRCAKDL